MLRQMKVCKSWIDGQERQACGGESFVSTTWPLNWNSFKCKQVKYLHLIWMPSSTNVFVQIDRNVTQQFDIGTLLMEWRTRDWLSYLLIGTFNQAALFRRRWVLFLISYNLFDQSQISVPKPLLIKKMCKTIDVSFVILKCDYA